MFVKQIDMKAALELAAKGREVMILVPGGKESGWNDMMPDTLQHMLEGCLFFRKEPAMEKEPVGTAPPPGRNRRRVPPERSRSTRGSCWPCIRPDGATSRSLMSWGSAM